MKCIKCNNELGANDKFCSICGTPVQKINEGGEKQNTYTYDRPSEQQYSYERQNNNLNQQNNSYGQAYTQNRNTTNNVTKICVSIVIGLIAVAIIFILGINVYKKNTNEIEKKPNTPTTSDSQKQADSSNNGQGENNTSVTTVSKTNSYKVSYNGFKLYIPDTLVYNINYSNKSINIGDAKNTWIAGLEIEQLPFQTLKQNKNALSSSLMQSNTSASISEAKIETLGGVEYIILECNIAGDKEIIGLAEMNSMYTAIFEFKNENNDFDRENIKNLSSIISTAEYIGESSYIKSNDDLKITDIDKALEAATKGEE